jgi:hypothetical protein
MFCGGQPKKGVDVHHNEQALARSLEFKEIASVLDHLEQGTLNVPITSASSPL